VVHLIAGIALLLGALFTGAAVYISLVEHPARMSCGTELALREWAPSYRRATPMQASLAVAAALTGIGTWVHGEGILWLIGGLLIFMVVPFTLVVIRPINDRLLAPSKDLTSDEVQQLLERWGRLHAVRSALGAAASLVYTYAIRYL
jgi:anthrone oxygenase-like protein